MAGLYDLLQNPRRLRQFAQTPGNFPAALSFASQGGMAARPATRARQSTAKEDEEGVLKTGEVIDKVRLPDGTYVRPATESGQLVKAPGKSNLYLDPATGEPYQADPAQPGGIRSAWSSAKRTTREGKEFAVIPGVGERELGPDPKAAEEAAKLTAKREAENRRLAFAREKRPYNIDRITGEPVPLQSDEEWQKQKAAKQAALDQAARVKRLKTEADLLKLDARQIELETPKPAKEDEDAFTAARDALAMIAPGEDADAAAERLANAPDTGDEAALVAKQSAQAYLASREKIRPAQEAAAKVREMNIRALDLEKQALNPDAWKAEKQASLKDMTDDDLMKEATAQAEIITKQESEASDKLNKIVTQRNALVEELNAFQARRQQAEAEGLSLNERAALDQQQADMEAAIADYDEWNSEATSEAQASLKAAADRREVLQTAGSEIENRNAVRAQTAKQAQARAAMLEKGRSLYETWGKGLYMDDWRDQPDDDARFQQEAAKAGLSLPEAKEALQTFRQLDWSNIKRDPKTAEPIEEQARLLPDGNVTVNPANLLDPEAYNAAVDAVDTTPEAKERAKAMRAELAAPVAEEAYNNLRKNADFAAWLDENTSGTPLERMEKFNAEMKAGGVLNAALMKFFGSAAGLPSGWLGAIAGLTGSDKAMEYANWWKDRAQAYGTAAGEAGKGTNMAGRFMASVAGGIPSVMESLAVGGVAGRVLGGAGKAALGAAAIDAMAQSGGGMFVDAVDAYIQQGFTPEEAKAKAAAPAIASGLVTAVLTVIGGGGVESLLRTEGQALAKAAIKRGIAAQVGEGVADETVEEWADQMLQGVVAQLSYDPNKSLEQVFAEATEAGLVGGVLGGGASGLRAFMDRNAPTEGGQQYTPEASAPEGGPAPTMPTQPRPAGQENVSKIIAAFKPTGQTPMPQAVNDTIKRTGRAPDQVAKAAASGLVKVAKGASLESLDAREREALGFINKDGKIVPAPKTTPLVEIYKDKLVIRNEAAEWLDDEGQPVLARQIKLDEAERKAQIDEAVAKPAAKKKAGQAKEKAAESKSRVSEEVITPVSLTGVAGATPAPATTPPAINPAEVAAQAEADRVAAEQEAAQRKLDEEAKAQAEAAERQARFEAMKAKQPPAPAPAPAPAPQAAPEPEPAAGGGLTQAQAAQEPALTPAQADQMARAKADYESAMRRANADPSPDVREKLKYAAGMKYAAAKRQITGKLTGKEAEAKAKREASNYEGKAVSVKGRNAVVTGTTFGKVKVKFDDGTKATVPAAEVGQAKPVMQAVTPESDELLGKNERGESIYWNAETKTLYAIADGRVKTAPWIEGLPKAALDRINSLTSQTPAAEVQPPAKPTVVDKAAQEAATSPAAEAQAGPAAGKPPGQMTPMTVNVIGGGKVEVQVPQKWDVELGRYILAPEAEEIINDAKWPKTFSSPFHPDYATRDEDSYFGTWGVQGDEQNRKQTSKNYRNLLELAVRSRKPISREGWTTDLRNPIPEGYVREGDLYVYRPKATEPAPASQPEAKSGLPPKTLPVYGVNSKDVAKQYGLPADFYIVQAAGNPSNPAAETIAVNPKYRTAELDAAEADLAKWQGVQGVNASTGRRMARERVEKAFSEVVNNAKAPASQPEAQPATPLARAQAALAAYQAKAVEAKKAATSQKDKNTANRKIVGAKHLAEQLAKLEGAVEYEIATAFKGAPIPSMMVIPAGKGGVLAINPAGLLDSIASNNLDAKAITKAIDKFIVHELIHKAALGRLSDARLLDLYNALTPAAKEASRKLYLAQAGAKPPPLNEFQAAHEWFAQLVEARMTGEISNQALIEASDDATFRDKLVALLRDFVAQLRDIAGLVKDKAMAEQIRAEADAVQAAAEAMAAKAGLDVQSKDKAAFYISEIRATNNGQSVFEVGVDKDGDGRSERELRRSFRTLAEAVAYGESYNIRNATPKPWALIGNTHVTRKEDANITIQGKPGEYEVVSGDYTRKFPTLKAVRDYLNTRIFEGSDAYADQIAKLQVNDVAEMRAEYDTADIFTLKAEAKKAGLELDKKATKAEVIEALLNQMAQAKASPPAKAAPETPADPNIGREWDSVYGRQRIISRDDRGLGSYLAQTVGTDTVRHYSIQTIDDEIRRQEYALTPEYAAEQEERKARAERQAQAEKAQEEAKAKAAEQVNAYFDDIGLNAMQRGKLKAALDQFAARRSSGTGKEYSGPRYAVTEQMVADGFQPQTEQVPAIKEPSGTQWNRMDNRQQQEFERKRKAAGMKTEYHLALPDGSMFEVTKAEHDYAKWLAAKAGLQVKAEEAAPSQPAAQAQPEPSPAQAVPPAGEADDTQVVADALKRHFGTKVETTKLRPGVFKAGRLVYGLYDSGKLTEKQVINGIPVGDNQVLLRMEEEEAQPTPAEAPALPPAEPYASPLAQFVGEWLGMNASQQNRVDMPQRVIRLAVNQADTEAVMALVQEAGTKGADGQLLFNTPHQRIYNELREALRYTLRKGMGTEKDKVSTQLTAVPAAAEAPALPPTQAAAVAKEEAMPEPTKQVAPFDAAAAKGQKKFLLAEVAAAVKAAPRRADLDEATRNTMNDLDSMAKQIADDESGKTRLTLERRAEINRKSKLMYDAVREKNGVVTIEVPGDGTFTILNEKGALAQFQKRADKFPVSAIRDDMPAKPTAQAPTAVPALKKPKTTADVVAAIYPMVSEDTTRPALLKVKGDGTHLWATDGRTLVKVEHENGGGTGNDEVLYDEKGNASPQEDGGGRYDGNQVIPDDKDFTPYTLDTGRWFSLMSQARAVLKTLPGETDSKYISVQFYLNPDGSLGVFASDPERGDYAHNIQPEAKFLAAYNPEYVQTILRVARNLGHEQVEMRIQDDITPATFRAGPALFVLMPMRVNGAPAYSPQAQAARPAPPVTAQAKPSMAEQVQKAAGAGFAETSLPKAKPAFRVRTLKGGERVIEKFEGKDKGWKRQIALRGEEMDDPWIQKWVESRNGFIMPMDEAQPSPEAPASQEPAQAAGSASIGQENVNAKHSREWSEVSTEPTMSNPRGSLKTDAIRSKTPSAPWYYQGDIRQLAFNQKVVEGGKSAATPEGAQTLKEYSAAVKDGWSYTSVRAGSYGTVYVFRKDKQVLTNAGAAALTSEAMARPEGVPESRGGNETNTVSRLAQYSAKLMEWLQTLPESTLNSPVALSTKMRNDVLAKWVRLREPDYKPYEWQLQYLKPDGKPDVQFFAPSLEGLIKKAINYAVIHRDMPAADRDRGYGYPEFKDAPTVAETLAANGFAQPAEPNAPETAPSEAVQPIIGFESARAFIGKLREGQVTAEQVRTAWAQLKTARPAILADLNKMKVDDLLPMAGISARKADGKAAIAKNVLNTLDMYFNPDGTISYSFGRDMQANKDAAMDEKVAKWTDEMIVDQARARREDAEARKAAREKALTNPETKDEWDRFVFAKGRQSLTPEEVQAIKKMKSGRNEAVMRKGESLLTPEQLATYDAVRGIDRKAAEQARTEAQARVYGVASGVEADIVETKHTQKGHDLFVVKLSERVERPVYDRLNAAAKKLGGYYSSYSKGGAVPGFQFTSRAAAENFIAVSKGETVDQKEQIHERREAKKSATASRLNALADGLDVKAEGILSADRKTNTAKRAREAAGQEANALKMQAMAQTMRNLAAAMESGEATHLDGVTAGTHVDTLDSMARSAMQSWSNSKNLTYSERQKAEAEGPTAEMMDAARIPYPYIDKSTILNMVEAGRKTPGAKLLAERVAKIQMNEDDGRAVTLRRDDDLENVKELAQKVSERGRTFWDGIKWKYETYDRLKAMGLTNLPSLRAALREYLQYRGKAAKADPVKAMERELIGMKLPGFFPTPRPIIDEMIGLAGIRPGMTVLEPSAGKGDIAEAVQEAGAEVETFETQSRLRDILNAKGIYVRGHDFMDMQPREAFTFGDTFRAPDGYEGIMRGLGGMGSDRVRLVGPEGERSSRYYSRSELTPVKKNGDGYDAVVMNPPFENGQDIEHVQHAYKFLKEGGTLVAVMSAGPFYRQDKQATAFREWLDEQNSTYEAMPEGSFAGADAFRQTGVRTYLVTIRKPYSSMPKMADEGQAGPGLAMPPAGQTVTPGQDAEYMAAVESGDMEKAQRMVDEAAYDSGFRKEGYHGTHRDFTIFDRLNAAKDRIGLKLDTVGNWFTDSAATARSLYGPKVVRAFLSLKKPLRFDGIGGLEDFRSEVEQAHGSVEAFRKWAKSQGYDGVEISGDFVDGELQTIQIVFDPNQIKSADPVTYDDAGNVIPLSQRFNPASPSILYAPPADQSADLEAAARAAMGEAEAGQPATEAEDLAETARLMDEQQKQAEAEAKAREELRNDPANIAAVEASGATAGRNLSKQFTDPAARSFYQALTAAREMLGGPETVVFEEVRKWAARQLESDPAGAIAYATELADNKTIPGVEGQAVLAAVIEALNREVAMTGDKNQRLLLTRLGNYYLDLGTTLAQTLGFRRDPLETPQDRWNKALRVVFGPAEKVRRRLRLAPTEAAKTRRIAELEAQLANYQGSRRADIEAALAEVKRQETQENIIAKEDAKNEKLKSQILGRMGLTERDLTLSPTDRYALQTAILDLPEVREALSNYPDGRDIMRQAMRGFSDEHIANSLGLNQDDVAKFIKDATNAIIRPAVKAEVKANRGFGDMVKSGLQSLARKVGLRMAAVSGPLGTMSPPLTAAELAKVEQEVDDILNFALQPAARRNKAGNLISKVIDTPGGKKVRVFVPFDPDDAASFYAFAREFSTAKSNVFDKLYEYWINWPLLGGPQTQVANITGNAAQLAWHYTGQRLAEAALNVAYRDPNSAQLSEFKHIATAFFRSMGPALDMARQSFLTEGDTVRHKFLNEPMEIEFKDGSLDKLGAYRPAIGGKAGRIARLPGRLLRFADAFFKTAILHTEAAALAYRKAHAAAKAQGLTGANRAAFIDAEMANDMNNPGSDVWTKAMGTAEELLFQDENAATDLVDAMLGGHRAVRDLEKLKAEAEAKGDYEAAARISNRIFWRSVWGKIMRLIFPFQRTPTNIIKAGLRKAGGAALSGAWHATRAGLLRYKEGKPFIESYTKAMQIKDLSESLLAGLGWLMLSSAFEGDDDDEKKPILIVGNRPYSPGKTGEREAFMRETGGANAILFRDKDGKTIGTFNFSRYEPVATLLSAWVDGYRNFREVNRRRSQGEPDASYLTYIGSSLFASVEGKSFLQGVSGLMETLRSFEERREPSTSNWAAKQLINAVVPNIIKQPLRNLDDLVRDTKNAGIGYTALPNPEVAPKLPAFQAEPKITTTGERIQKGYTAPARLLFAANAKVTPQPDALLLRANRLNPTKAWFPQPLQKDDFYVRTPGAKPGTPGYKTPIADPAKKRQFAELSGKFYAQAARQIEAATPPAVKAKPTPALIEAYKKARTEANARARAVGGIMGLHK